MKITATLSRYLAKTYLLNFLSLFIGLLMIVYLFDTVELIRRGSKFDDLPLSLILQMGLLKLPEVGQVLFPFAILFSAMFTFWQLTKRSELVVVRAAGFSIWQFLAPVLAVAFMVGIMQMSVINPIGALLVSKFEQLEQRYLERRNTDEIALFREGLWLRQDFIAPNTDDGRTLEKGYLILRADKIHHGNWQLDEVSVFFFDQSDRFLKRLQARSANLQPGQWMLDDSTLFSNDGQRLTFERYALPTRLTSDDIEESFSSPESMSFWRLPSHIKTLEQTGFDATKLRVHYQNLLSQPLMFAAMVLLAATVSMRPPRFQGGSTLIGLGIFIGFVVFFSSSFLQALGASGQIPVILAAWAPSLTATLLGLSVIMNLEDG